MLDPSDKHSVVHSTYVEPDTLPGAREYAPPPVALPSERVLQRRTLRREVFIGLACLITDALLLSAAIVIELTSPSSNGGSVGWAVAFAGLTLLLLGARGAYAPRLRLQVLDELRAILAMTAISAMAVISARVLAGENGDFAASTARYWLWATVLLAAGRALILGTEARARRRGEVARPTLIVGAGKVGRLTARRLLEEPEIGMRPIGFLDEDPLPAEEDSRALPVLGESEDLDRLVAEHDVRQVIVTFSRAPHDVLLGIVRRCQELGVEVAILPRLFEVEGERATVERLGSLPLVSVGASNPKGWQYKIKYAIEWIVAALALLVSLPFFILAVAAVKLTMGGPVFFRQRRVGADGREFEMLKLRTMKGRPEDDEESDIDWALEQLATNGANVLETPSDPRRSPVDRRTGLGRLLRRFSLDELPQLWNVLRGEMSLVGPRPERVSYVERFEDSIYRYRDRHRVKSGITGWAQVNGLRGKTSLSDRVEWDNYYIENWSPWLDVKIVLMTVKCILTGQHEEGPWSR